MVLRTRVNRSTGDALRRTTNWPEIFLAAATLVGALLDTDPNIPYFGSIGVLSMRNIWQAIAIAFAAAGCIYGITYPILGILGVNHEEIAGGLAAIPIAGSPHIVELLERSQARRGVAGGQPNMIHSFKGFAISWPILALYGMVVVWAIMEASSAFAAILGGFIAGYVSGITKIEDLAGKLPTVMAIMGLYISIPIRLVGGYLLGRWIGTRCARYGILALLLSVALGAIASMTGAYFVTSADTFKDVFGAQNELGFMALAGATSFCYIFASGLLGYWRGRRRKLSRYMLYLLSVLPNDVRSVLVDLAFEEAQNAGKGRADSAGLGNLTPQAIN
jgi:hypothetical protein